MTESQLYDFLGESRPFTLDVAWEENEAKMTLFSESIYVGRITREGCSNFYNSLDIAWEDYYKNLKDLKNEVYKVKFEDDTLAVYKSVEDGIEVIYVQVKLKKLDNNEIVAQVVHPLLSSKRKLQEDLSLVRSSQETLQADLDSITKKFEESVRLKMEMQETLLNKFMHILNEKKRYINHLKGDVPVIDSSVRRCISSDEEDMDF